MIVALLLGLIALTSPCGSADSNSKPESNVVLDTASPIDRTLKSLGLIAPNTAPVAWAQGGSYWTPDAAGSVLGDEESQGRRATTLRRRRLDREPGSDFDIPPPLHPSSALQTGNLTLLIGSSVEQLRWIDPTPPESVFGTVFVSDDFGLSWGYLGFLPELARIGAASFGFDERAARQNGSASGIDDGPRTLASAASSSAPAAASTSSTSPAAAADGAGALRRPVRASSRQSRRSEVADEGSGPGNGTAPLGASAPGPGPLPLLPQQSQPVEGPCSLVCVAGGSIMHPPPQDGDFSGFDDGEPLPPPPPFHEVRSDVLCSSDGGLSWHVQAPLPFALHGATAIQVHGTILLFGGVALPAADGDFDDDGLPDRMDEMPRMPLVQGTVDLATCSIKAWSFITDLEDNIPGGPRLGMVAVWSHSRGQVLVGSGWKWDQSILDGAWLWFGIGGSGLPPGLSDGAGIGNGGRPILGDYRRGAYTDLWAAAYSLGCEACGADNGNVDGFDDDGSGPSSRRALATSASSAQQASSSSAAASSSEPISPTFSSPPGYSNARTRGATQLQHRSLRSLGSDSGSDSEASSGDDPSAAPPTVILADYWDRLTAYLPHNTVTSPGIGAIQLWEVELPHQVVHALKGASLMLQQLAGDGAAGGAGTVDNTTAAAIEAVLGGAVAMISDLSGFGRVGDLWLQWVKEQGYLHFCLDAYTGGDESSTRRRLHKRYPNGSSSGSSGDYSPAFGSNDDDGSVSAAASSTAACDFAHIPLPLLLRSAVDVVRYWFDGTEDASAGADDDIGPPFFSPSGRPITFNPAAADASGAGLWASFDGSEWMALDNDALGSWAPAQQLLPPTHLHAPNSSGSSGGGDAGGDAGRANFTEVLIELGADGGSGGGEESTSSFLVPAAALAVGTGPAVLVHLPLPPSSSFGRQSAPMGGDDSGDQQQQEQQQLQQPMVPLLPGPRIQMRVPMLLTVDAIGGRSYRGFLEACRLPSSLFARASSRERITSSSGGSGDSGCGDGDDEAVDCPDEAWVGCTAHPFDGGCHACSSCSDDDNEGDGAGGGSSGNGSWWSPCTAYHDSECAAPPFVLPPAASPSSGPSPSPAATSTITPSTATTASPSPSAASPSRSSTPTHTKPSATSIPISSSSIPPSTRPTASTPASASPSASFSGSVSAPPVPSPLVPGSRCSNSNDTGTSDGNGTNTAAAVVTHPDQVCINGFVYTRSSSGISLASLITSSGDSVLGRTAIGLLTRSTPLTAMNTRLQIGVGCVGLVLLISAGAWMARSHKREGGSSNGGSNGGSKGKGTGVSLAAAHATTTTTPAAPPSSLPSGTAAPLRIIISGALASMSTSQMLLLHAAVLFTVLHSSFAMQLLALAQTAAAAASSPSSAASVIDPSAIAAELAVGQQAGQAGVAVEMMMVWAPVLAAAMGWWAVSRSKAASSSSASPTPCSTASVSVSAFAHEHHLHHRQVSSHASIRGLLGAAMGSGHHQLASASATGGNHRDNIDDADGIEVCGQHQSVLHASRSAAAQPKLMQGSAPPASMLLRLCGSGEGHDAFVHFFASTLLLSPAGLGRAPSSPAATAASASADGKDRSKEAISTTPRGRTHPYRFIKACAAQVLLCYLPLAVLCCSYSGLISTAGGWAVPGTASALLDLIICVVGCMRIVAALRRVRMIDTLHGRSREGKMQTGVAAATAASVMGDGLGRHHFEDVGDGGADGGAAAAQVVEFGASHVGFNQHTSIMAATLSSHHQLGNGAGGFGGVGRVVRNPLYSTAGYADGSGHHHSGVGVGQQRTIGYRSRFDVSGHRSGSDDVEVGEEDEEEDGGSNEGASDGSFDSESCAVLMRHHQHHRPAAAAAGAAHASSSTSSTSSSTSSMSHHALRPLDFYPRRSHQPPSAAAEALQHPRQYQQHHQHHQQHRVVASFPPQTITINATANAGGGGDNAAASLRRGVSVPASQPLLPLPPAALAALRLPMPAPRPAPSSSTSDSGTAAPAPTAASSSHGRVTFAPVFASNPIFSSGIGNGNNSSNISGSGLLNGGMNATGSGFGGVGGLSLGAGYDDTSSDTGSSADSSAGHANAVQHHHHHHDDGGGAYQSVHDDPVTDMEVPAASAGSHTAGAHSAAAVPGALTTMTARAAGGRGDSDYYDGDVDVDPGSDCGSS